MYVLGKDMSVLAIVLLSALGGVVVTGGTLWVIESKEDNNVELVEAITHLESEFEKAQATTVVNLTQPDLLKVPCSLEYINQHGDLLCREMFCRMNRQGGGTNSSGGAGSTESDCSAISGVSINLLKIETCMSYWDAEKEHDQNSKYSRCVNQFTAKP